MLDFHSCIINYHKFSSLNQYMFLQVRIMAMAWLGPFLRLSQGCNESDSQAVLSLEAELGESIFLSSEPIYVGILFFFFFCSCMTKSPSFLLQATFIVQRVIFPYHEHFSIMVTHFVRPARKVSLSLI